MDGPGAFHSVADGDLSNQADNYPGFPSVHGLCLKQQRAQQTPANNGSAGTQGCSHSKPVSHFRHLHHPTLPFFTPEFYLLPPGLEMSGHNKGIKVPV